MSAALAFRPDCLVNARPTLRQQHAANDVSRNFSDRSHDRSSSLHANHATESAVKSYNQSYRPFRERVSGALKARLHPKTNLHVKQLAHSLQLSEATIWNLLSANNEPSGRVIDKLVEFFRDPFVNEIWGCHNIVCFDRSDARRAAALRRIEEAKAELQALES